MWKYFLKTLLGVKITSGHLLSEECDHLGKVDWSRGLSNLQGRDLMAKPQYLKKTHHVVGLAIADWPSNSLQHLSIKAVIYGVQLWNLDEII